MPRHPDFQKIYTQFQKRYCTGSGEDTSPKGGPCKKGDNFYYGWLTKMGLDDTKPYGGEASEQFKWAEPLISFLRDEEGKRLYKVEAAFPVSSMNNNVYTEDELIRGSRTLKGKPVNLNHETPLPEIQIVGTEFEDGATESIIAVPSDLKCPNCESGFTITQMLSHDPKIPEEAHIHHVSIEAGCARGREETPEGTACLGLEFGGLALLTKKVLPGIPLTRIMPVEKLVESFSPLEGEKNMAEVKPVVKPVEVEKPVEPMPAPEPTLHDVLKLLNQLVGIVSPKPEEPKPEPQTNIPSQKPSEPSDPSVPSEPKPEETPKSDEPEKPVDAAPDKPAPSEAVTPPPKPAKPDLIKRVVELKLGGMSARDAWRLASFELLDWIRLYGNS